MTELRDEIKTTPSRTHAHLLGKNAPEMANFQTEPKQMHSGANGKSGYLKLRFRQGEYRSELAEMERRVPSLVQKALYWDEEMPELPCVTMISTSGCLLQGDRQALDIIVEKDACAHVTTQSATKIHMMDANYASQVQRIQVAEQGYLELMPDPIIPHRTARFITDTTIELHPTATVIYSEILQSGRKHHHQDERFGFDIFSSRITANYSLEAPQQQAAFTNALFVEKYILEPSKNKLNATGIMGNFDIFGNVILLTPKQYHNAILERLEATYDAENQIAFGATLLPNDCGIVFKALAIESQKIKHIIRFFWQVAREEIKGSTLPKPFLWR